MNKWLICIALVITGCATRYNGPSLASMTDLCKSEGHTMRTLSPCLEKRLDRHYPAWKKDKDASSISYLLDYSAALGAQVSSGEITNDEAWKRFARAGNEIVANNKGQSQAGYAGANNAAMIAAGAALISASRPVYAPATQVYPQQETVINVQQPNTYRFIDSSPYR